MRFKFLAAAVVLCVASLSFAQRVPLSEVQRKKDSKTAISLFQPWTTISGGIIDTAGLHKNQMVALHDLIHHHTTFYGLKWVNTDPLDTFPGNAEAFDSASIVAAQNFRKQLLELNPNLIMLGEIRFYDAAPGYLPDNSPMWMRNSTGGYVSSNYMDFRRLDFNNAQFQTHCANQCKALLATGVVDGIFLDWAKNQFAPFFAAVRNQVGNDAVLIGNINHHYFDINLLLPHLNGVYMECGWWGLINNPTEFFFRVHETITRVQAGARAPKIICTEIWSEENKVNLDTTGGIIKIAAGQEHVMRAGVAVHYTHTSGYYSFYPQDFRNIYGAEHMHIYHDFLNANLGAPIAGNPTRKDSAYIKEWTNGAVVFNPPSAKGPVTVKFSERRRSQMTGKVDTVHTVPVYDGDIFLKGNFQQLYPAPAGFKSSGLPYLRPLPDTTYKNQFVKTVHSENKTIPLTKAMKINTMINNQQVIIQKKQEGVATKYYTTQGRQIKVGQLPKK